MDKEPPYTLTLEPQSPPPEIGLEVGEMQSEMQSEMHSSDADDDTASEATASDAACAIEDVLMTRLGGLALDAGAAPAASTRMDSRQLPLSASVALPPPVAVVPACHAAFLDGVPRTI